jgi:hypothetical protein
VAHYRAGQSKDAAAAFAQSIKLRDGGDPNDWLFMAMIRSRLNEREEAKDWYDRSLAWIKAHASALPQFSSIRAEAEAVLGLAESEQQKTTATSSR